jgi:spermidine/putrescine transport system ATP-binding protein
MANDADLELVTVSKRFDDFIALRDLSLTIPEGEFFSFLGPSGCGKTTILRLISGFIDPTAGDIRLGGMDLRGVGPNRRPTALIFQNLALFPMMTVAQNIAFGLESRGIAAAARARRVRELLELIALPDYGGKKIAELSGGQKQRVAIARALAVEPKVLLLDEPLSALDLKLRQHMRAELRAIQRRTGITFIYITHDQSEALAMSDRVAVMSQGVVEQIGAASDIYDWPATAFVASFVGETNMLPGRVIQVAGGQAVLDTACGALRGVARGALAPGDEAILFVRPERLRLANGGAINVFETDALNKVFEGAALHVYLRNPAGRDFCMAFANDGSAPAPACGTRQRVTFAPESAVVLPKGSLARQ